MTLSHAQAPARRESRAVFEGAGVGLVLFIWAVFALATAISGFPGVVAKLSTDDAMRLVEVRDLLAGQSWFDLTQYRLNPPDGVIMHWSRLIDLPIALMLALLQRLLSPDAALAVTATLWPLLLLLPAVVAVDSASRTIGGPRAGVIGAFLLVLSPGVTTRFQPGAIDHHGAQIALALTLLACALRIDVSRRAAIGAGLAAAAMTAIGMETAPHVAVCAAMIALRWAVEGPKVARGAALFGLAFGAGTAIVAVTTLSPAGWSAPVCDTLGAGHLAIAIVAGFGLALACRLCGRSVSTRIVALAQIGVASGAALWLFSPNCLSSPYAALPERLQQDWLAHVQEAQPFFAYALNSPTSATSIGLPLLVAIGLAVWALSTARRETIWPVATVCAMFATALAITAWQVRGVGLAFAMAGPLFPAAALALGRRGTPHALLAVVALSPTALALVGVGAADLAGLPSVEAENPAGKSCAPQDYAALDALPLGLALNAIDTGPFILAFSKHSAVAAPYHRNVAGLSDSLDAFDGSEAAARAVAVSRRASYIVACPLDGGVTQSARQSPDGFSAALLSAEPPSWLAPIDLGPGVKLRAFRVLAGTPD